MKENNKTKSNNSFLNFRRMMKNNLARSAAVLALMSAPLMEGKAGPIDYDYIQSGEWVTNLVERGPLYVNPAISSKIKEIAEKVKAPEVGVNIGQSEERVTNPVGNGSLYAPSVMTNVLSFVPSLLSQVWQGMGYVPSKAHDLFSRGGELLSHGLSNGLDLASRGLRGGVDIASRGFYGGLDMAARGLSMAINQASKHPVLVGAGAGTVGVLAFIYLSNKVAQHLGLTEPNKVASNFQENVQNKKTSFKKVNADIKDGDVSRKNIVEQMNKSLDVTTLKDLQTALGEVETFLGDVIEDVRVSGEGIDYKVLSEIISGVNDRLGFISGVINENCDLLNQCLTSGNFEVAPDVFNEVIDVNIKAKNLANDIVVSLISIEESKNNNDLEQNYNKCLKDFQNLKRVLQDMIDIGSHLLKAITVVSS